MLQQPHLKSAQAELDGKSVLLAIALTDASEATACKAELEARLLTADQGISRVQGELASLATQL